MSRFAPRDGRVLRLLLAGYAGMLLLLVLSQGGCGPSARQTALKTAHASVNASRDGLLEYSRRREAAIVASPPTSLANDQAKIAAFRVKVDKVTAALLLAYDAIAVAALDKSTPYERAVQLAADVAKAVAMLKQEEPAP